MAVAFKITLVQILVQNNNVIIHITITSIIEVSWSTGGGGPKKSIFSTLFERLTNLSNRI
jgi:hypothetical protein